MEKIAVRIADAVTLTGIGKTSLYKLVRQGKLKAYKLGSRTLFLADDLVALVKSLPPLSGRTPVSSISTTGAAGGDGSDG